VFTMKLISRKRGMRCERRAFRWNESRFNQNVVVSVPGNTRFYIVVGKDTTVREEETQPARTQQASNAPLPTANELQQLMQLRRELSEMYQQSGTQSTAQQVPQQ